MKKIPSQFTSDNESVHPTEPDIDQLIEAFNEMHQVAQKLAVSNNRFKSTIKVQFEKLVSIQTELNNLKFEHEKLINALEISGCICENGLEKAAKYKQLETLYETFRKAQFDECSQLQTEISYYKDLLTKAYQGNMTLKEILSLQRIATDKTGLGYNKQTKFASHSRVNPNQVFQQSRRMRNGFKNKSKVVCNYCMMHGHTNFKCYFRKYHVPNGLYVWMSKTAGKVTNPHGPNIKWVPASSN